MIRRSRALSLAAIMVLAATTTGVALTPPANSAHLCGRTDRWITAERRYIVMNNVWGAMTAQCLDVRESGAFRITRTGHAQRNATPAAYPMIFVGCHWGNCTEGSGLPVRLDRVRGVHSDWTVTGGAPGRWNATYDLWFHRTGEVNGSPDGGELMIWLDRAGGVTPSGALVARGVRINGGVWDVWYADWQWQHISYVRTSRTSATRDFDLNAFTRDALSRGYLNSSWHLSAVEAGFEIWRGGAGLASTGFGVTIDRTGPPYPVG